MEMAKKKTVAMKKCADSATGKLGVGERLAYGYGDTACNIVFGMISTLLTLFYTDYAGAGQQHCSCAG